LRCDAVYKAFFVTINLINLISSLRSVSSRFLAMGFLSRVTSGPSAGQPGITRSASVVTDEKGGATVAGVPVIDADQSRNIKSVASEDSDNEDELVHKDMQQGVQKVEAIAQVWPRWALYLTYAL
jgi:hypothetical protein